MKCSSDSCGCNDGEETRRGFLKRSRGILVGFGVGTTTVMLGREKAWASGCGQAGGSTVCFGPMATCVCEAARSLRTKIQRLARTTAIGYDLVRFPAVAR